MEAIFPTRLAIQQRLLGGALLVAGFSLLDLIGLDLGPFGSPWPLALLWAICGWAGIGPNVVTSIVLMVLGLWVDVLTGSTLGTWAFIALVSFGGTLLASRYLGLSTAPPLVRCAITGLITVFVSLIFTLWRGQNFDLIGIIVPVLTALLPYIFIAKWFDLSEDET